MTIYAVYSRYFEPHFAEEVSIDRAIETIQYGNETGEMYGVGVIDTNTNRCYVSDYASIDDLKAICSYKGIEVSGWPVETFPGFPEDEATEAIES